MEKANIIYQKKKKMYMKATSKMEKQKEKENHFIITATDMKEITIIGISMEKVFIIIAMVTDMREIFLMIRLKD